MIRPFVTRRTRQPQQAVRLDWSHPLARNLALAWVASAGDLDLVTGKAGSTEGTRPSAQPFAGRLGRKFSGNGDISFGTRPDLSFSGLSNQTLFAEVFIPDTTSVSNFVCGRVQSNWDYSLSISSANQQFAFGTGGLAGGNAVLVPAASVGGGLAPYQGRPVPLCGTYDKVTAKLYVDGILKNSAALTGSFPNDTDQFAIGSRGGGNQTSSQLNGAYVSIVLIFKRTLNDAEVASLSANPWQLFASAPSQLMAEAASSGASGTFAATLGDAALAASGGVTNPGAFASSLANASMAASGTVATAPTGSLSSTLANATMAASGGVLNAGALASTLQDATLAASGALRNPGTFAATLGNATLSASGTVVPNATGTLGSTLDNATLSAGGFVGIPPAAPDLFLRLPKNPRHFVPLH
jgi:hypothetical protein